MAKQNETEREFAKLPACAAEFIKLVIKKMRYRKKVRRDVQAELAAHFEDELKDYTTDGEKEQKAQKLIGDFGDVKLLAVLLRRAKKRCRPLWRTVVARTFQTVGIIIVCFILYVAWFLSGKPVITTDYVAELNRIVRPAADDSSNAAPLYVEAAELIDKLPDETKELLSKEYKEVTSEQKQLIEKWLNENKEILELVIAGSKKPYYWQKYANEQNTGEIISILMPHLSDFRELAYSLCWRAQLRAEQGRYEDAFGDIKSCYRFGQHLKGNKMVTVEQLVGIGIEAIAVQTIRDILSEYKINSATLAALQQDFEKLIADEDFAISVRGERMFMYDVIQRCFTVDKIGGGHLYLKIVAGVLSMTSTEEDCLRGFGHILHILFTHPNKQETLTSADEFYDYLQESALKTPARRQAEQANIDEETQRITSGNLLLEFLAPAFSKVIELSYRIRVDVEATLTVIAILRYAQNKGGYPASLEELVTRGYIKELPIDPWSDKPLVYKKTDDNFILYSIGRNFTDDGGEVARDRKGKVKKWADEGDVVFWPVDKK